MKNILVLLLCLYSFHPLSAQVKEGDFKIWGTRMGLQVVGLVEGPATATADLQVACVFEYTEGDIYNSPPALPPAANGMQHLDKALHGIITDIRKTGQFEGHTYETILLDPAPGSIKAKRLLLIGLGNRNQFDAGIMKGIGTIALREALRLNASTVAIASDLKDAGIDSPTAQVAENIATGALQAWKTQAYLRQKGYSNTPMLKKIILLAGPAFYETAGTGIVKALEKFPK
ncbi:cytosol aminopeptidase family protein [Chitinophaga dinghuensis]|uniref:Cytosol aminopeptidase family protein n=1 Tax=Chitinophaga dinghuensis TaxID=1539050 RepID=A0A327W5P7_9BACT|nr:M17 family peptidase N-terminal domain-containing protein [Chitinophaga dinghuensis]RAJ80308.1 cytosol aminopeptidase family protein [Chitinophaga dinghuensis]